MKSISLSILYPFNQILTNIRHKNVHVFYCLLNIQGTFPVFLVFTFYFISHVKGIIYGINPMEHVICGNLSSLSNFLGFGELKTQGNKK